MRNALVIVIVCLSVSLLYDVYKEPIDRLLHLDQTETNETTETGNRKQKTKKQAQKPDGQQEEGLPSAYDGRMTGKAPEVKNQGTFGTCWAVVTSSALESRLLPQEDIIFSADHISTQNSYAIGQEEGGAYNIAIAYLTAWQGPVTEEMDPYGDGVTPEGLSPVKHVQEKGLKKIVLILTRPEGYRKKPTSKAVGKLYRKMYSKYPALVRTCIRRPVMYNRTEEYIEKLEKEGNIFVLRPEMKPVSRLEKDYDKLMAFYDHGYEMMKRELPRLEAYLEK